MECVFIFTIVENMEHLPITLILELQMSYTHSESQIELEMVNGSDFVTWF